jgi:hypothetical protein
MRFIGAWYWVAHNGNCPCNLPNLPNLFKCIQLSVNNETLSFYLQRARARTHTHTHIYIYRERERVRLHWLLILSSVPCWVSRKDHKQLSCTWQFPLLMWHQQLCLPHQILPGIRVICHFHIIFPLNHNDYMHMEFSQEYTRWCKDTK